MSSGKKVTAASSGLEVQLPWWWREDREAALAEVTTEANRRIQGELADVLGTLSVAPRRHCDDAFNGLCIRSEPLPAFGGAEFRLNTGSSTWEVPARALAGNIAAAALRFQSSRDDVARIAMEARAVTDEIISSSSDVHLPAKLVAVSIVPAAKLDDFRTIVTVESLGDGLIIGPDTITVASSDNAKLREELETLLAAHARRTIMLARHRTSRSRGLIDQTAQRMMAAAGMDLAFALDRLERSSMLQFRFDDGQMLGSLEWKEDVLTGEVNEPDNESYVWDGSFTFWKRFSETVRTALIGRPLSTVAERPYLPVDAVIKDVWDFGDDGTRLSLKIPTEPLPDVGTHMWADLT